ncbi:MAG: ABC transporter substrate-binding protein [Pontibacterium sp.]
MNMLFFARLKAQHLITITITSLMLCVLISPTGYALEVELGASKDDAAITVGCLYPLSGRGGLYGNDSAVGIQLAFEALARRKQAYPPLRVLIADSRSKGSRAARLVRHFIHNEQARFLCGVVNSAIAAQVINIAAQEKVFFVGTDHASSRLSETPVSPYYFRVNNNSRQSNQAAARYIAERFGSQAKQKPLRISYLGPDYDYGYQMWEDLQAELRKRQVPFDVVMSLWPKLYEPDYGPYLRALLREPTDIVINSLWGGDLVAFVQQANRTALFKHAHFANFDTGGNYEVLAALGDDMPTGLILSARHHNNWPQTRENQWFVNRFYALSGRYPSYAAEGAYAGIMMIARALAKVGAKASDEDIRTALQNAKLSLPEDPSGFVSYMDKETHQIQQVIAIGETLVNKNFPPATRMLGNWRVYYPDK